MTKLIVVPVSVPGMVTIPVSMYQTVVNQLGELQGGGQSNLAASIAGLPAGAIQVVSPTSGSQSLPPNIQVVTSATQPQQLVGVETAAVTMTNESVAMVTDEDSQEDIKPLTVEEESSVGAGEEGGGVPDATQAVEVMSVETAS